MGKEYSFHKLCLAAIFFFDGIALFLPFKGAKNGDLSALIFAIIISAFIYFVWYFLADKIYKSSGGNGVTKVSCFLIIAFLVFTNAVTSKNFINFISKEVLIKNPKIYILILFSAICIYMVSKSDKVVAKAGLLSFVFIVIVMTVMLIVSCKNFEPVSLKKLFVGKVFKRSFVYLYKALLFPIAFAIFSRFAFYNVSVKKDIFGFLIGTVLILVCYLSAVLTFTLHFASKIDYAYPISISVVNIGELYTRMDGFAYFIFFFSALIRSSICGFGIKMLLKKMNIKYPFEKTSLIMLTSFAVSYII